MAAGVPMRHVTMLGLVAVLTACSGDAPGIDENHPWAEELNLALEIVTSDFEREALADGVITREEYEMAHDLWLDCMEQTFPPDGSVHIRLIPDPLGRYTYEISGLNDETLDLYDTVRHACMTGTIEEIAPLYNDMTWNPDNVPRIELVFACLEREGLIPDDYTIDDYEHDRSAEPADRHPLGPHSQHPLPDGLFYCMDIGWAS